MRRRLAAVGVVALVALTGCSAEEWDPDAVPTVPAPSSSPVPTVSPTAPPPDDYDPDGTRDALTEDCERVTEAHLPKKPEREFFQVKQPPLLMCFVTSRNKSGAETEHVYVFSSEHSSDFEKVFSRSYPLGSKSAAPAPTVTVTVKPKPRPVKTVTADPEPVSPALVDVVSTVTKAGVVLSAMDRLPRNLDDVDAVKAALGDATVEEYGRTGDEFSLCVSGAGAWALLETDSVTGFGVGDAECEPTSVDD